MKKFSESYGILKESNELNSEANNHGEFFSDIKEKIEKTIETSGGEYDSFMRGVVEEPENFKIQGLINDSDLFDYYHLWTNEIDSILNEVRYFDTAPSENNIISLYDYVVEGTLYAVTKLVELNLA